MNAKNTGWKMNVQGVKIESDIPEISVRDALLKAEFNPDQGWIIILKSASGKRQVDLAVCRTLGRFSVRISP